MVLYISLAYKNGRKFTAHQLIPPLVPLSAAAFNLSISLLTHSAYNLVLQEFQFSGTGCKQERSSRNTHPTLEKDQDYFNFFSLRIEIPKWDGCVSTLQLSLKCISKFCNEGWRLVARCMDYGIQWVAICCGMHLLKEILIDSKDNMATGRLFLY